MSYAVPLTRREAIVQQLRHEIVTGALPPGTVVKDAEVATRLGVSITPVREAIAQLAAEGLIDIAPNRTRRVTGVTGKNALELLDVMSVLAVAGFEWGVENLTESHLNDMAADLAIFVESVRLGRTTAALAAGADFSTVVIMASGNRELQTHVDLVVARFARLHALILNDDAWAIWITGYQESLAFLRARDTFSAVARYRQIYQEFRAHVERVTYDAYEE